MQVTKSLAILTLIMHTAHRGYNEEGPPPTFCIVIGGGSDDECSRLKQPIWLLGAL